ncbi:MAG TPA: tetratricopeptide repeat protein, partial [Longimicrobiales bacterium]
MPRITGWLAVLTLMMVQALPAQAQRGRAPTGAYEVRLELASVLLQSKRYHEAAREYRGILAQRPNNFNARLGLARALAWSRQHREAEAELRFLHAQQPRNSDVLGLLRSVRQSIEPAAAEAA